MGDERSDDAADRRRADVYSSARIGAAAALTPAKRHLADLRARSGLTTEQLIDLGRAEGWLVVPALEDEAVRIAAIRSRAAPATAEPVRRSIRSQSGPSGRATALRPPPD